MLAHGRSAHSARCRFREPDAPANLIADRTTKIARRLTGSRWSRRRDGRIRRRIRFGVRRRIIVERPEHHRNPMRCRTGPDKRQRAQTELPLEQNVRAQAVLEEKLTHDGQSLQMARYPDNRRNVEYNPKRVCVFAIPSPRVFAITTAPLTCSINIICVLGRFVA